MTGKDKGAPHEGMDRDGAGVELFLFGTGRIKTQTVWFKNRLPALRHGHIHMILCCLTKQLRCAQIGGVEVKARSGFRTRFSTERRRRTLRPCR